MLPPCGWFRCRCTADWIGSFHFAASSSQERRYFRLACFSLSNQLPRWFSSATQSNKKEPDKLTLKAHYFIAAHNHLIATAVRLVGMTGFEPATTCTPCKCATRLRYIPIVIANHYSIRLSVRKCKYFFISFRIFSHEDELF